MNRTMPGFDQVKRLLLGMVEEGQLEPQGAGKATYYELAPNIW